MSQDKPNRDEKLEQRKRELEDELERYAQAGISSPNVLRAARWISRGLYLAMAVLVVFLLVDRAGRVSKENFDRVLEDRNRLNEQLREARTEREQLGGSILETSMQLAQLRSDVQFAAADSALRDARALTERLSGERAYAQHWRARAELAQAHAHGIDPVQGARGLIEQAAYRHAAGQHEELRLAGADFGLAACREAATALLQAESPEVRAAAARLLARVQAPEPAPGADPVAIEQWDAELRRTRELLARSATLEQNARAQAEIWFAWALHSDQAPGTDVFVPEAWLGFVMRVFDPDQKELIDIYRNAPEESRVPLLALLSVSSGSRHAGVFSDIAISSQRSEAERIIAVRWFADRKEESGRELLQGLSTGAGPVAAEAARALGKLRGE